MRRGDSLHQDLAASTCLVGAAEFRISDLCLPAEAVSAEGECSAGGISELSVAESDLNEYSMPSKKGVAVQGVARRLHGSIPLTVHTSTLS
jgi:hypothetical protein